MATSAAVAGLPARLLLPYLAHELPCTCSVLGKRSEQIQPDKRLPCPLQLLLNRAKGGRRSTGQARDRILMTTGITAHMRCSGFPEVDNSDNLLTFLPPEMRVPRYPRSRLSVHRAALGRAAASSTGWSRRSSTQTQIEDSDPAPGGQARGQLADTVSAQRVGEGRGARCELDQLALWSSAFAAMTVWRCWALSRRSWNRAPTASEAAAIGAAEMSAHPRRYPSDPPELAQDPS